jgi:hypothetical protein
MAQITPEEFARGAQQVLGKEPLASPEPRPKPGVGGKPESLIVDVQSFEQLADALRSIETRVAAVQLSLTVTQQRQRDRLGEVCRDLRDLIANVGGWQQA